MISQALLGWYKFWEYADEAKNEFRFVRGKAGEEIERVVRGSVHERAATYPAGMGGFYRAREGALPRTRIADEMEITDLDAAPISRADMGTLRNWGAQGRVNPPGIPCLYLGTEEAVAIAEIRPWIGSQISLGIFELTKNQRLVDCSRHHNLVGIADLIKDEKATIQDGLWFAIDRAFAMPVTRVESEGYADYLPTQILADVFKREGYDGLIYKSLLSPLGLNIALFDVQAARCVDVELRKVTDVKYKNEFVTREPA